MTDADTTPDATETDPTPKSLRKSTRTKAGSAISKRTEETANATGKALSNSPLAALAGAIAVGAVAAALIPATKRELSVVGPLGNRIRDAMGEAVKAARDAGSGELSAAGLTLTAATTGLSGVIATLVKAATVSAIAAGSSVRETSKAKTSKSAAAED